jgi:hypothetical protein
MKLNRRSHLTLSIALGLAAVTSASAQSFPSRPVTLVVPFPPGGGTDTGGRIIAEQLGRRWGQTVVVENRGGAAGQIGADVVAKAKTGWLYPAFGQYWYPGHQPVALSTPALQRGHSICADLFGGRTTVGHDGEPCRSGQHRRRVHCVRKVATRQAELQQCRCRRCTPPCRRNVQGPDRHLHPACALSRWRAPPLRTFLRVMFICHS